MMQVGISQLIQGRPPAVDFFRGASQAGYEVVEVCMRQEGEISLSMGDDEARTVVEQAKRAGVKMVSMCLSHCTGNLLDSGEAQTRSIQETVGALKRASGMGIGCVLTTLGSLRSDLYYDQAFRNAVASLKSIAPDAEAWNVDVAIEFVWNGFLFSPLEMRRLIEEVGSPRVGFYMDPGNMAVFQFPHHWARALAGHVKMVHLKDWKGGPLKGEWTALLKGDVDFAVLMKELRNGGYDGPLISEVDASLASLEDTAKAIRKIIAMG